MGRQSRWVDPAPLEVTRPRLPWWTMLPGKAKLVLLPVVVVWVGVWLLVKAVRLAWYYPTTLAHGLAAIGVHRVVGWWVLGGLALVVAAGLAVRWWRDIDSARRWTRWARTETRRAGVYAAQ